MADVRRWAVDMAELEFVIRLVTPEDAEALRDHCFTRNTLRQVEEQIETNLEACRKGTAGASLGVSSRPRERRRSAGGSRSWRSRYEAAPPLRRSIGGSASMSMGACRTV